MMSSEQFKEETEVRVTSGGAGKENEDPGVASDSASTTSSLQKPAKQVAAGKDKESPKEEERHYKTTIADRLTKALDGAKIEKSRTPELVLMKAEFDGMKKNIHNLILSAKTYQSAYGSFDSARAEVGYIVVMCIC
jgi:hypothetical protein